jgi:hypothetical protein
MVWTTEWPDQGIGIAHAKDLIQWSGQKRIDSREFNEDGAIKPVRLTTNGIGPVGRESAANTGVAVSTDAPVNLVRGKVFVATASSCRQPIDVRGITDPSRLLCREDYVADCAIDQSNFTRWLPAADDSDPRLMIVMDIQLKSCRSPQRL